MIVGQPQAVNKKPLLAAVLRRYSAHIKFKIPFRPLGVTKEGEISRLLVTP